MDTKEAIMWALQYAILDRLSYLDGVSSDPEEVKVTEQLLLKLAAILKRRYGLEPLYDRYETISHIRNKHND